MRFRTFPLVALAAMVLIGGLAYNLPPVHDRLSWRVDFAMLYFRRLMDPIQPLPSPAAGIKQIVEILPTSTILPSATWTASPTNEATSTPLPLPTPLPKIVQLPSPKWEKQDINNCGPAALTMYLRNYGWEGTQDDIAQVIKPFPEDRNVNVEELAYYVRTQAGWLNTQYRVGGNLDLLRRLLASGIPVMIEESFYFEQPYWADDDLWAAHYQLLTGYDENRHIFIGQDSFHGPDLEIPEKQLDEYWQAFNRVYILIYRPDQESIVKDILGSDWDVDKNRENALQAAKDESQAAPENAYAWFNLGTNLTYFERYIEATDAYDKARELGLPQRMLRYQFGPFIAYFHTGQMDDLITLSEYAIKVTPNAEEALLWHGWAMYRNGKIKDAIADFEKALVENPKYQDAIYALDFVRTNR